MINELMMKAEKSMTEAGPAYWSNTEEPDHNHDNDSCYPADDDEESAPLVKQSKKKEE